MTVWFYRSEDSSIKGPVSPTELLELIRQGIVRGHTQVRKGDSPWVPSSEVAGLYEAAARPSVAFDCPYCGKSIAKPPTRCAHCKQLVQKATGHLVQPKTIPLSRPNGPHDAQHRQAKPFGSQPGLYD